MNNEVYAHADLECMSQIDMLVTLIFKEQITDSNGNVLSHVMSNSTCFWPMKFLTKSTFFSRNGSVFLPKEGRDNRREFQYTLS